MTWLGSDHQYCAKLTDWPHSYLFFCICRPWPNLATWPTTDLLGIPDWLPNDGLLLDAGLPMLEGRPLASADRLLLPLLCLLFSVRILRGPKEERSVELDLLDMIWKQKVLTSFTFSKNKIIILSTLINLGWCHFRSSVVLGGGKKGILLTFLTKFVLTNVVISLWKFNKFIPQCSDMHSL